jgi:hypothetical protein
MEYSGKRIKPIAIGILAALAIPSPALHANPATLCDGKYAETASLIDAAYAKYGTLYSGGLHHHIVDDVGATLDLYRLWRGLPDAHLRSAVDRKGLPGRDVYDVLGNDTAEQVWSRAKWALTEATPPDKAAGAWAAAGLDYLTSIGPSFGWWQAKPSAELTDWQRTVATLSKTAPGLDWLQTILAASDTPWANHRHLGISATKHHRAQYQALSDKAFTRFQSGEGIEWLVAAAQISAVRSPQDPIRPALKRIEQDILSCNATPSEYAAYSVSITARERAKTEESAHPRILPDNLHRSILRDRLVTFVFSNLRGFRSGATDQIPAFRKAFADDPEWQRDVDLAQLYTASALDRVPISTSGPVRRAYNMLSTDDLLSIGRKAKEPSLITAAFGRFVALENWDRAIALLSDVTAAVPDQAVEIARLWALSHPVPVRLSLIALHTRGLSSLVAGGHPMNDVALVLHFRDVGTQAWYEMPDLFPRYSNMPREYGRGGVLQRDFEVWLRLPQRSWAFSSMRGMTVPWLARLQSRHRYGLAPVAAPSLFGDSPRNFGFPFAALMAPAETHALTTDQRLLHTVARIVTDWAAERTDSAFERKLLNRDEEANALARLIHVCKFESCGTRDGLYTREPMQQRAFRLLHGRMGDTEAAGATRAWFKSPGTGR